MRLGVGGFQRPSLGVGVSRFRSSSTASAPPAGFSPETTFTSGDLGWVYDFDDMDTLWADTAATIPAVMNGRVARVDDKSPAGLNRTQSTEANRPFLRGTPTGANTFSNFSSPGTGWVNNGNGTATATTSSAGITASGAATAGRVYRVIYTITRTAGSVTPSMGGVSGTARSAAGTYIEYFDASNTNALVFTGSGYSGTVSAIDIRDASADSVTTPNFLHYNGTSSSMQSASTNFSSKTFFTVVTSCRPFSSAIASIVEMSTNASTQNGAFSLTTTGTACAATTRGSTGTPASISVNGTTVASGSARVQTGLFNLAGTSLEQNLKLRMNGVADSASYGTTVTIQSGAFGTHVVYFGSRAGTSQRLYGLEGSSAAISKSLSSAVLTQYEQWAADKCGLSALGNDSAKDGVAPNTYSGLTFWYDGDTSQHYSYNSITAPNGEDFFPANNDGNGVGRADSVAASARTMWRPYNDTRETVDFNGLVFDNNTLKPIMSIYTKPASGQPAVTQTTSGELHTVSTAVATMLVRVHTADTRQDYFGTAPYAIQGGWFGLYVSQPVSDLQFFAYNWDDGADYCIDPGTVPAGEWAVVSVVHKAGRLHIRVNGSIRNNIASGSTGDGGASGIVIQQPNITSTVTCQMDLAQLVTYNTALTDQQISNIEKAFCDKLGVTFRG